MKKSVKKILIPAVLSMSILIIGCSNNDVKNNTDSSTAKAETYVRKDIITSSEEAKELLVEGNKRFINNNTATKDFSETKKKQLVTDGQHPFAVIISCSDSRVPDEEVFDQGLGDIFVIRNAGNVIDPISLGSIEYGAEHLGTPLIVVMGHEKCGAVKATVDGGEAPGSIGEIVNKIKVSLDKVKGTTTDKNELYTKCEDENIKNTIAEIKKSSVISKLEEEKKVEIVGAKYNINTGEVVFEKN